MVDFLMIGTKIVKNHVEVYPKFIIKKSQDLMIRGADFYAVWLEDHKLWSTDEQDAVRMIDCELDKYANENKDKFTLPVEVLHLWDAETGMIDRWHTYCKKQLRDNFVLLDTNLTFSNTDTNRESYASKRLKYPIGPGDISAYDKMMSVLYSDEERHKLEWAIGAIVSGDSKKIQKFIVLYGSAGTGKSTVLNIVQWLFEGYYATFDAKSLGSSNSDFALESFKSNPLVAIQHDGDLSKIEDNTRLNSLVSHELMTVNEKFKAQYQAAFNSFLFMASNNVVKITNAKSGLIRRLIDVSPTGNKLVLSEYRELMKNIKFELGAIAQYCMDVYQSAPDYYDSYIPLSMMSASNDFYNFVLDSYPVFAKDDGVTLKLAWDMYKQYVADANIPYPFSQRVFKEELRNYFRNYEERSYTTAGDRVRSYYSGFRKDRFEMTEVSDDKPASKSKGEGWLSFSDANGECLFDTVCSECAAQYANTNGTPTKKWSEVLTTLKDIDTSALHYVRVPENHIVIDFDIPDTNGKKNLDKNLEEALKWPPTYAELSKSGAGIHLHYIYNGDVSKLSRVYDDRIEIKVFNGNSSLRRKLSKCNNLPIATISSGLPLKDEKKMVNFDTIKDERMLRILIRKNLNKEIHPGTKPSIDFIYKLLNDAYDSGICYDVSDLKSSIFAFASNSTHQSEYCMKLAMKMKFKSEEPSKDVEAADELVFYDVEVFPNLFLVNWKKAGPDKKVVRMINPSPSEIDALTRFKLVGFNCRKYDNHMLYGRMLGYTNAQLFDLSKRIIGKERNAFFGEAYNLSYTDIYDFSSVKQSLKKFEIELGIHHQELGLPWDKPVPEEMWPKVAEYCDNDVLATEAVFFSPERQADFTARKILAKLTGMTVNSTTNDLSKKFIFQGNKTPQNEFNYRDLGDTSDLNNFVITPELQMYFTEGMDEHTKFNSKCQPVFPGYKFDRGKSSYWDVEDVGEGGRVYAEPGMYINIALLDIASMHPSSIEAEQLFGERYTKRFSEIKLARIYIKHKDYDKARSMLDGALAEFLTSDEMADALAGALKIVINSIYGLTSARFANEFKDPRNIDNIVAKRGALFMINLQHEVQSRGYIVAHIKTDSIKIPEADMFIINFVTEYGKMYGYNFEHEATYDRMCLVNNAVYIAKYATLDRCYELYGKDYVNASKDVCKNNKKHPGEWTATGAQFAIPYVFKKLFSKEEIVFSDLCETKQVQTSIYLDFNEGLGEEDHNLKFVGKIGLFCPMMAGSDAGLLVREAQDKDGNTKYDSVTGTKGYRWMEAENVEKANLQNAIDLTYFNALVDAAVEAISQYGDFEWFTSNVDTSEYVFQGVHPWSNADDETTPFDVR